MTSSTVRLAIAAALVAAASLVLDTPDAGACGNDVWPVFDPKVDALARARDAIKAGKHEVAATLVHNAFPDVLDAWPASDPQIARAVRLLSLAVVRSDGAVSPRVERAAAPARRAANIDWAVQTLRRVEALQKNDAWRQTDLAEAMSKLAAHRAEALELLEKLAAKDVVASAEGYAALAGLRAEKGDEAGRDAALARCKRMTLTPTLCKVTGAVDAPRPKA